VGHTLDDHSSGVTGQGAGGYGMAGEEEGLVCCEPVLLVGGLGLLSICMWFLLVPDATLTGA